MSKLLEWFMNKIERKLNKCYSNCLSLMTGFKCIKKTSGSEVSDEDNGVSRHSPRFKSFRDMNTRLRVNLTE